MLARLIALITHFPRELVRLYHWRHNRPHTFGCRLMVNSNFDPKTETFICKVWRSRFRDHNTFLFKASTRHWDYLHPTRQPHFPKEVAEEEMAEGGTVLLPLPTGYRLVNVQFHDHPVHPHKMVALVTVADFYNRFMAHTITLPYGP